MKVRIKNIGIIEDSEIDINGLTVITGKNNSGKSTVGKVLYSVFYALEDLYDSANRDICFYVKIRLTNMLRDSIFSSILRRIMRENNFSSYNKLDYYENSIWKRIFASINNQYPNEITSIDDIYSFLLSIKEDINNLEKEDIEALLISKNFDKALSRLTKNLEEAKQDLNKEIQLLLEFIDKQRDFSDYETIKIIRTLSAEFSNQITPVKYKERTKSNILIQTDDGQIINVKLVNSGKLIEVFNETVLTNINNVVFFDDSKVVNNMDIVKRDDYFNQDRFFLGNKKFGESVLVETHSRNILKKLVSENSIFSELENKEKLELINKCISKAFNQEIEFDEDTYYCSNDKLDIRNLAMGTKSFLVIKQLIKNGYLNEKSLLILDEPETHLHPEWQNIFAETVVLLVKELGVKVLLTTHSPNFILAIETYMLKYKIKELTNFYITEKNEDDYLINYKKTNDSLSDNYVDFANYFSEIKNLRDDLLYDN